jgi:hypothetical protein
MQKPDLRALRAFINSAPVSGAALHAQAYAMAACSPSFQFA